MTGPDPRGSASRTEGILRQLAEVVGAPHVLTDPSMLAGYVTDWTGRFEGASPAVVRPGSVEEVSAVVRLCRESGVAITLQGGNTGLVGGGVPLHRELVVSLRRLDTAPEVADAAGRVVAGAGTTIGDLQRAATAAGWAYGVDFASRDSATVGGSVATNAGGLRVVRNGDTRAQLAGIEAVLGTGAIVSHLSAPSKDNTGYDLASLLCGSEGTLGVVTRVDLRLVPPTPQRTVGLLAFARVAHAVGAAAQLRRTLPTLAAAELVLADGLALVCSVIGAPPPFAAPRPAYLLVEAAGRAEVHEELSEAVDGLDGVADAAVALDSTRAQDLWQYRERLTEAINSLGPPHKLDVSVPIEHLGDLVERVPAAVQAAAPGARTWLFGHAADGNVHINISGVDSGDEAADDVVLQMVAELGGSISAEHGVGTAKRRWLTLNRSNEEIAAFRAIKGALDPDGILNPNVLLPAVGPGP